MCLGWHLCEVAEIEFDADYRRLTSGYRFPDLDPFKRRFEARLKSITLPLVVRASLTTSSFARFTSSAERAMPSI